MLGQLLSLILLLLLGAFAGHQLLQSDPLGPCAGMFLVCISWCLFDQYKIKNVLKWLRDTELEPNREIVAKGVGGYIKIIDRVVRLQRALKRINADNVLRLNDFLSAIQVSPNGVLLLDSESRIEWCNQTAAYQLGIDMKKDVMQLIANLVRDPIFSNYLKHYETQKEIVIQSRDSRPEIPRMISLQLFPSGEGRRLLLSRDITQFEQAEVMRRDFVANVSHEIRTPLTVLAGFVETLLTLPVSDEERQRYLELMSTQATRMQTLVNDLLTLSKLEGSPVPSKTEWTPVMVLWRQCNQEALSLSQLLSLHPSQQIKFEWLLEDEKCEVAGSRNELFSAMTNLVSNAVRYTPEGGTINVSLTQLLTGDIEFTVNDSGPGIAPEHIPRLTERFYRIDRSRSRDSGGTGLGLAIVKHVAQRHDSLLSISSQLGKGSTFSIRIPSERLRKSTTEPAGLV